jgi:hypothetical protein
LSIGVYVNEPLVRMILDSLVVGDDGDIDWGDDTDRLIEELGRRHNAAQLAKVIRDNAPCDCDLDRLGFFIGILLNGFPPIDDSQLVAQLAEWVHSPVEAEFRCAISELHILYHCDHTTESIMTTFGDTLEQAWPAYRDRIRRMRELWLADVERVQREKFTRRYQD